MHLPPVDNFARRLWPLVLLSVAFLSGCAPQIRFDVMASSAINPDRSGEPLSVLIRAYQLEDVEAFEKAGFSSLVVDDEAELDGWLERTEFVVRPGEMTIVEIPMEKEARYVAVVALYRTADEEGWGHWEPLPGQFLRMRLGKTLELALDGNALLAGDDAELMRSRWLEEGA